MHYPPLSLTYTGKRMCYTCTSNIPLAVSPEIKTLNKSPSLSHVPVAFLFLSFILYRDWEWRGSILAEGSGWNVLTVETRNFYFSSRPSSSSFNFQSNISHGRNGDVFTTLISALGRQKQADLWVLGQPGLCVSSRTVAKNMGTPGSRVGRS